MRERKNIVDRQTKEHPRGKKEDRKRGNEREKKRQRLGKCLEELKKKRGEDFFGGKGRKKRERRFMLPRGVLPREP